MSTTYEWVGPRVVHVGTRAIHYLSSSGRVDHTFFHLGNFRSTQRLDDVPLLHVLRCSVDLRPGLESMVFLCVAMI